MHSARFKLWYTVDKAPEGEQGKPEAAGGVGCWPRPTHAEPTAVLSLLLAWFPLVHALAVAP